MRVDATLLVEHLEEGAFGAADAAIGRGGPAVRHRVADLHRRGGATRCAGGAGAAQRGSGCGDDTTREGSSATDHALFSLNEQVSLPARWPAARHCAAVRSAVNRGCIASASLGPLPSLVTANAGGGE